jgi:hypothetical protein
MTDRRYVLIVVLGVQVVPSSEDDQRTPVFVLAAKKRWRLPLNAIAAGARFVVSLPTVLLAGQLTPLSDALYWIDPPGPVAANQNR